MFSQPPLIQVKFQDDHIRRASMGSRKLGKKLRSWGVSFPCPLNAWGLLPALPWPKAGPLLRACSSLWRSKLLPSAQPKWLQMAGDFTKEKCSSFAYSTATSSPPHRHGEEHQSASSPGSPSIPVHRTKLRLLPHHPHPTREPGQRLLLLATTPISAETWLFGAFDASFPSSPLPTLTSTRVKCSIINPCKNKLVLEQWPFVIYPFLPHNFCQRCHCTSQGNIYKVTNPRSPHRNFSPPHDSWALLWLCLFSKQVWFSY